MKPNLYYAALLATMLASQTLAAAPAKAQNTAPPLVCLPTTATDTAASWTEEQKQLGMGIAAFDEGQLTTSLERIKRALRGGLNAPMERAAANKYLALIYCANRSASLCRKHFEAAIVASPDITFDDTELRSSLHRQSLAAAQQDVARRSSQRERAAPEVAVRSTKGKGGETGTLRLDIRPWAQVLVNDRPVAITPPSKSLTLEAGEHRLEIRNPAGPPFRADVTVPVGGSIELAHRF
ncbi:MAG: hypothetical protein ACRDAM_13485 [Casimicrobium sp.]